MARPQNKKRINGVPAFRVSHALVIALLFGGMGAYLLFGVKAEEATAHYVKFRPAETSHTAGTTFSSPVSVEFELDSRKAWQVNVLFTSDTSKVSYVRYECSHVTACVEKNWKWKSSTVEKYEDTVVCFNWSSTIREGATIFRMFYKAKVNLPAGELWSSVSTGIAPGTCRSNPTASGVIWSAFSGTCSTYLLRYPCDNGPGGFDSGPGSQISNNIPGGRENEGQGPSSGQQNTGSGGGGGSTANQQDDQPSSLPSPSPQGDTNKQPDVEPSPFFDGKLFAVGSDEDTEDINGVSVAGQKFGYGWVYLSGGLLVLGLGILSGWRWWRNLNPAAKANFKARFKR